MSATSTWTSTSPSSTARAAARPRAAGRRARGRSAPSCGCARQRPARLGRRAHGTSTTFSAALPKQRQPLREPLERHAPSARARRARAAAPPPPPCAPASPTATRPPSARAGTSHPQAAFPRRRRAAPSRPARPPRAPSRRRRERTALPHRPARPASTPARCGSRSTANTVSPAPLQHRPEQPPDEAVPDDEHPPPRHPLGPAQHARERLDVRADARRRPTAGSSTHPDARTRSANPPGTIVGSGNCSQVDACPLRHRGAGAAARVVDQRHAAPVRRQRDDLVPEHRPRRREPDLLHVRPAQPAGEHRHELARRRGLRDVGQARARVGRI